MTLSPALRVHVPELHEFASLRTARLVAGAVERVIRAGHELDECQQQWREIDARINSLRGPIAGQWQPSDQVYYDATAEEHRITGRIVRLQRELGIEVPL